MGFGANRQRCNGNELLEPVCQHIELYFRFCGSLHLRLVVQPGWLWLRLEALRCRSRLVSVRLWQLVHGPVAIVERTPAETGTEGPPAVAITTQVEPRAVGVEIRKT